jgi:hypothetical protein
MYNAAMTAEFKSPATSHSQTYSAESIIRSSYLLAVTTNYASLNKINDKKDCQIGQRIKKLALFLSPL